MLPDAFLERMRRLLGPEYDAFLASYQRPRNVGLRWNPLKASTFPSLSFVRGQIPWEPYGRYYDPAARPGLHPYHEAGLYYLQEPSAMSASGLLQAQPGERVLDLCAAPGGKATQLAASMRGSGLLVCNEFHPGRAKILSRNLERMAAANALALNETPEALSARFPLFFDKILVDAPCSGEGMFRKEDAAWQDWSEDTVRMCAARQLTILNQAAKMLAGGGRLVYSTCTFSPEENEGVVSAFLHTHPEFSVCGIDAPFFSPGRPDWIQSPAPGLAQTFRLWPHKLHGEGHFAAVLTRNAAGRCSLPFEASCPPSPEFSAFSQEYLTQPLPGRIIRFGQNLCAVPEELPSLSGLRVLRAGLTLGQDKPGRFEPSHALALWLKTARQTVDLAWDSEPLSRYLRGEALPGAASGWTLLRTDGYSIGWAKGSAGMLKNHYPKGLRRFGTEGYFSL